MWVDSDSDRLLARDYSTPLVRLTILVLEDTNVTGDVGALAPLAELASLHLDGTQVGGDVKGLAPMVKLTSLNLANTRVSGRA